VKYGVLGQAPYAHLRARFDLPTFDDTGMPWWLHHRELDVQAAFRGYLVCTRCGNAYEFCAGTQRPDEDEWPRSMAGFFAFKSHLAQKLYAQMNRLRPC